MTCFQILHTFCNPDLTYTLQAVVDCVTDKYAARSCYQRISAVCSGSTDAVRNRKLFLQFMHNLCKPVQQDSCYKLSRILLDGLRQQSFNFSLSFVVGTSDGLVISQSGFCWILSRESAQPRSGTDQVPASHSIGVRSPSYSRFNMDALHTSPVTALPAPCPCRFGVASYMQV